MSETFELSAVSLNNGENDTPVWIIVKGSVYDVTNFLLKHPGGRDAIAEFGGKDATKAFNQVGHSAAAIREMKLYKIGLINDKSPTPGNTMVTTQPKYMEPQGKNEAIFIKPDDKIKLFCCC